GPNAVSVYDHLLRHPVFAGAHDPDLVVVVGRIGVSKTLLGRLSADVPQVLVDGFGGWHDPARTLRRVITADPALTANALVDDLLDRPDSAWLRAWRSAERQVREVIDAALDRSDEPSEPRTARDLAAALPDGSALTVASSMPVRDLTMFMRPRAGLRLVANRGASGIDGFVSTALGVAAAHDGPAFALAGDLSVLHDSNGLLPGPTGRPDLVLVLLNNDGGGIFSFLPQAASPDGFETLYGTPHGVDFAAFAAAHDCGYRRVASAAMLADDVRRAWADGGVQLVEVRTDRAENVAVHRRVEQAVLQTLDGGLRPPDE
ncbi:MAG TPA: thiamine pyrophosphate-dependent enzyme, partial [Egibacteraceae bacterium]|nr:thiamine pyrophosphate-dependent enzyme [Egibacteraceae bacterium]